MQPLKQTTTTFTWPVTTETALEICQLRFDKHNNYLEIQQKVIRKYPQLKPLLYYKSIEEKCLAGMLLVEECQYLLGRRELRDKR